MVYLFEFCLLQSYRHTRRLNRYTIAVTACLHEGVCTTSGCVENCFPASSLEFRAQWKMKQNLAKQIAFVDICRTDNF